MLHLVLIIGALWLGLSVAGAVLAGLFFRGAKGRPEPSNPERHPFLGWQVDDRWL